VPVLLYHQLIAGNHANSAHLTDQYRAYVVFDYAFAAQMNHLHSEGYTTISLDEFSAYHNGQISLPKKPIIITFDDGFASNYVYAFPVLKKYRMKATIFVTADRESENFKKHAATDSPLSHEQMREMSDYGISIQSHAMTHKYLTELTPERIRWELTESKKVLEAIVGKPVRYLAIPSGAYDRTVKKLTIEAGYKAVFCMLKGSNNKKSDPFALRRLVIGRDFGMDDFRKILRPSTAWYLRVTSSIQNALLFVLGPSGLDSLRNVLYQSRLGSALTRSQVNYFVPTATVLAFLMVAFSFIMFLRIYF
jgi:peptidoglycan/xylan/chitin deacetylase (PgdA/CDA1 family)